MTLSAEKGDRWLWLRTLLAMTLAALLGWALAHWFNGKLPEALDAGRLKEYLLSHSAHQALENLDAFALSQAGRGWLLWPMVIGAGVLLLLLPALLYQREPARQGVSSWPRRWVHNALRLLLWVAFGAGVNALLPGIRGGQPAAGLLMGGLWGLFFVLVGQRCFDARLARLRAWRSIPRRDLFFGFVLGAVCGFTLYGLHDLLFDKQSPGDLITTVLGYTAVWSAWPESPVFVDGMRGFERFVLVLLVGTSAVNLGMMVALAPTRATWRQRSLAMLLVLLPVGGLMLYHTGADGRSPPLGLWRMPKRLFGGPSLAEATRLRAYHPGSRSGEARRKITWQVAWPTPDGIRIRAYDLQVSVETLFSGASTLIAEDKAAGALSRWLKKNARWSLLLPLASEVLPEVLLRRWRPEEALVAQLAHVRRTNSVLGTTTAAVLAMQLPLTPAVRRIAERFLDASVFRMGPRSMPMAASLARHLGRMTLARQLWARAKKAGYQPFSPWSPLPKWHGGRITGCLSRADIPLPGVRVGLFRVLGAQELALTKRGATATVVASMQSDEKGCFTFGALPESEYFVGVRLPPELVERALKGELSASGNLGPVHVHSRSPQRGLGQIHFERIVAQPAALATCGLGQAPKHDTCACAPGAFRSRGRCCWPGQEWSPQAGCAGTVKCSKGFALMASNAACSPLVEAIPMTKTRVQLGAEVGNGRDPVATVVVPRGPFARGKGKGAEPDEVQREVTLESFSIDRFEVSVARYRECVKTHACVDPSAYAKEKKLKGCNYGVAQRDGHPINCISWLDARRYCHWTGKRLPTEAEWERAARGTDGRPYPWGDTKPRCEDAAFHRQERPCRKGTAPVDAYAGGESPYGARQMAGNVAEWVSDWYGAGYYERGPGANPRGPAAGRRKVTRGGSWSDDKTLIEVTSRQPLLPSIRRGSLGFRCAADLAPRASH
ncbi:MAG: SUMF1/EgtB/PvdO family nonheme iron enzyme [Deltaproteobacteria bacterium]|nr:SUMF1/EgtB/PvdO family nonheme iron enzyme [Deltaproteobacteria bacterium]